jgi:hypothetical protein
VITPQPSDQGSLLGSLIGTAGLVRLRARSVVGAGNGIIVTLIAFEAGG